MSEKLKVGDRVRLTYVGTVKSVYDGGGVAVIDGQGASPTFAWSDDAVESVEVLTRTFRPGTLVLAPGGVAVRMPDHWAWVHTGFRSGVLDDNHVDEILSDPNRVGKVLYEPTT